MVLLRKSPLVLFEIADEKLNILIKIPIKKASFCAFRILSPTNTILSLQINKCYFNA